MLDKLFDLRFVIGAFFFIIGNLILIHSFTSSAAEAQGVNRGCSALFIAFGILMLLLSRKTDATDRIIEADGEMSNERPDQL